MTSHTNNRALFLPQMLHNNDLRIHVHYTMLIYTKLCISLDRSLCPNYAWWLHTSLQLIYLYNACGSINHYNIIHFAKKSNMLLPNKSTLQMANHMSRQHTFPRALWDILRSYTNAKTSDAWAYLAWQSSNVGHHFMSYMYFSTKAAHVAQRFVFEHMPKKGEKSRH